MKPKYVVGGAAEKGEESSSMRDESYNGWTNWDTWATSLWATNDQDTYNQIHDPWVKNIRKKMDKGTYDHDKMVPAIKKYYVPQAVKKASQGGDKIDKKKVNADEITKSLEDEAKNR